MAIIYKEEFCANNRDVTLIADCDRRAAEAFMQNTANAMQQRGFRPAGDCTMMAVAHPDGTPCFCLVVEPSRTQMKSAGAALAPIWSKLKIKCSDKDGPRRA